MAGNKRKIQKSKPFLQAFLLDTENFHEVFRQLMNCKKKEKATKIISSHFNVLPSFVDA